MDPLEPLSTRSPAKRAFSLFDEFRNFAFKGNVIDLAVGVIIGASFSKIIDSLVKNIIMPLVGLLLPGDNGYAGWKLEVGGTVVPYGLFIGEIINFLIVALALFLFIVKFLGWVMKSRNQEAEAPAPLTKEQELLSEIRDLLAKNQSTGASDR